jgi:hypothetical protein
LRNNLKKAKKRQLDSLVFQAIPYRHAGDQSLDHFPKFRLYHKMSIGSNRLSVRRGGRPRYPRAVNLMLFNIVIAESNFASSFINVTGLTIPIVGT